MAAAAPTFSYAQAAKGEVTPITSSSPGNASTTPGTVETTPVEMPSPTSAPTEKQMPNGEPTALPEVKPSAVVDETPHASLQTSDKVEGSPAVIEQPKSQGVLPDRSALSQSTSTVASSGQGKDDASAATPNESDSTWDKVSQVSQSDTKTPSKADSDNEDSKLSSWEHVPPAVQLKEAPLPAFNIWHKRAADAKTKGQDQRLGSPHGPPATNDLGNGPNLKKSSDANVDASAKRKMLSPRQPPDERSQMSSSQELVNPVSQQSASSKTANTQPPPTDAMLWPTPEGSNDERKKTTEKVDKLDKSETEKTPSKSHGKDKWVQMPYVPTAVFNTPLPTNKRGGRATRGGREGNGRGASNGSAYGGEKPFNGSSGPQTAQVGAGRGDMGPPRQGAAQPKIKRASSAGPSTSIEARRTGDEGVVKQIPSNRGAPADGRRISSGQHPGSRQWSPSQRGPASEAESAPRGHPNPQDSTHSRNTSERRNDMSRSGVDPNSFANGRERGEGRPDRGRGGYRGRGNFSNAPGSHQSGGQNFSVQPGVPPGYPPAKAQSYSDPRRESMPAGSFQASRESRHYRNNSRSQSIPTSNFGRFPGGPQHLPQLHTENANMYYPHAPPGVMSAAPYPGYVDQMQLHWVVQMQMEYYFSVENLCKDMFLRKQMDSQGFVFLDVLQKFNRIKQLTQDADVVRFVCSRSGVIELLTGGDGIDRIRRRGDWVQWVMPMEERDNSAQNDGPAQLHLPQPTMLLPFGDPKMMQANGPMAPKSATYATHFRPEPLSLGDNYQHPIPTTETPSNTTPVTDTPLSAAVPDFTPSMQMNPAVMQYAAEPSVAEPISNTAVADAAASKKNPQVTPSQPNPPAVSSQGIPNGSINTAATQGIQGTSSPMNGTEEAKKSTNGDTISKT